MIDRDHDLAVTRHAEVLKLSRSSLHYQARSVPAADLAVMRRIDELHMDYPLPGSWMLRDLLRSEGVTIGRQQVARMMKRTGIAGGRVLPRSGRGSACEVWPTRDFQLRSGRPGHQGRGYRPSHRQQDRDQWTAKVPGVTTSLSSDSCARSNTKKSCAVNMSSHFETARSFTGDGGRPPEVGLQGRASNRHKLRG
jgi:hypothetical protein